MRQAIVLALGALLFAALGYVTVSGAPAAWTGGRSVGAAPQTIQANLQDVADAALSASGLEWAQVTMNGQIAVLSGTAPRQEEIALARAALMAAGGKGGFWSGPVIDVVDETRLAAPLSPYAWGASLVDGRLTLTGAMPSRSARADVAAHAGRLFNGPIDDQTIIARGAPTETGWLGAARLALTQLAGMERGDVTLRDEQLRIEGSVATTAARDRLRNAVASLPPPFVAVVRLQAEAGVSAETFDTAALSVGEATGARATEDASECQGWFDEAMTDGVIAFASGRSSLEQESYGLLDTLAQTARSCSDLRVVVEGHTDNVGDPGANQRLSASRAQAVADYFILRGVASERLEVIGHGADRPIADNDTPEGRAANRRIAFRIEE